jgi:hypothetical protein
LAAVGIMACDALLVPLLQLDPVTDDPEIELFEAVLPPLLEALHPLPILGQVGHVNDDAHEIISIEDASVSPVALGLLRFVAGGAELVYDLQNGFG